MLRIRLARVRKIVLLASVALLGSSCRPVNPPNALTAMLRAVPRLGDGALDALRFTDFAQARKDLGLPRNTKEEALPNALRQTAARLATSPLGLHSLYSIEQIEAAIEVTPQGAPPLVMLVGAFDSQRAFEVLESLDWTWAVSGLFRLYRSPDGAGLGVGPRRLVFSPSYETAESTTAFRGGSNSLLSLEGLQTLAISSGRPAAFAATSPAKGCLDPRWIAAGVKYLAGSSPAVALVVGYGDSDTAAAARGRVSSGLAPFLSRTGLRIELVDARRELVVVSVSSEDSEVSKLLDSVHKGSELEKAVQC